MVNVIYLRMVLVALFLAALQQVQAQYQNIKIGNFSGPNEPSIAINPKNTQEMMAGSNLNYWYYSQDGGYNWSGGVLESPEYGVWGDPVIVVDTAGDFFYFHLANPQSGTWIDRIVCQKFDKQSMSWSPGTYMGLNGIKKQDKEWAVIDQQNNAIYVTWTQFDDYGSIDPNCQSNIRFSKSMDGGETWSEAISINEVPGDCIDSDNTVEGAVPAVGPNGEVYVSWSGPAGIVFDRSLDGGETWLDQDVFVTAQPGGWNVSIPGMYRCNGMPVTRCDLSGGPHHGTIYINYADQSNGANDTDVWLVKSIDGGFSWSEPIRVNDDLPGKHQFFSWMAIDPSNGSLYFVFYDRRNHSDNSTDVFMAVSHDGGLTFENFKISESPFTPSGAQFFGDYNNISAVNNVVRPIWTRRESNGSLSIYTAIVDMTVATPLQPENTLSLEQNVPNPFIDYTLVTYSLQQPTWVELAVYDAFGRKVKILVQQKMAAGKHTFSFENQEHKLPQGTYFLHLKTEHHQRHQKMIVAGKIF